MFILFITSNFYHDSSLEAFFINEVSIYCPISIHKNIMQCVHDIMKLHINGLVQGRRKSFLH